MTTNEFYYNDGIKITSEEAHALTDRTKLVVADRAVTKIESNELLGVKE